MGRRRENSLKGRRFMREGLTSSGYGFHDNKMQTSYFFFFCNVKDAAGPCDSAQIAGTAGWVCRAALGGLIRDRGDAQAWPPPGTPVLASKCLHPGTMGNFRATELQVFVFLFPCNLCF